MQSLVALNCEWVFESIDVVARYAIGVMVCTGNYQWFCLRSRANHLVVGPAPVAFTTVIGVVWGDRPVPGCHPQHRTGCGRVQ